MDSFFQRWAQGQKADEDVDMDNDEAEGQLNDLKKYVDEVRPRIQENLWLQSVIKAL